MMQQFFLPDALLYNAWHHVLIAMHVWSSLQYTTPSSFTIHINCSSPRITPKMFAIYANFSLQYMTQEVFAKPMNTCLQCMTPQIFVLYVSTFLQSYNEWLYRGLSYTSAPLNSTWHQCCQLHLIIHNTVVIFTSVNIMFRHIGIRQSTLAVCVWQPDRLLYFLICRWAFRVNTWLLRLITEASCKFVCGEKPKGDYKRLPAYRARNWQNTFTRMHIYSRIRSQTPTGTSLMH